MWFELSIETSNSLGPKLRVFHELFHYWTINKGDCGGYKYHNYIYKEKKVYKVGIIILVKVVYSVIKDKG